MLFASLFMVGLIASLVMVSRASTFSKKLVCEWQDQDDFRPSQQLLDIMSAMSPAEKIALFPTLSVMSSSAPSVTPELTPATCPAPVRISA